MSEQIKLKEIYLRDTEDINYQDGILEHSSALETYISKIKMILNTSPGDVFGFPDFGAGLETLIFSMGVSVDKIKEKIFEQIGTYCKESEFFNTDVDISFYKGKTRDIVLIDIVIDGTKAFGVLLK